MRWGILLPKKIVEPSLGKYNPSEAGDAKVLEAKAETLTALEKRG